MASQKAKIELLSTIITVGEANIKIARLGIDLAKKVFHSHSKWEAL